MPISPEELKRLPPAVAALLQQGGSPIGDEATPLAGTDPGQGVTSNLHGALSRRFGNDYDAEYDAGVRSLLSEVPQAQSRFAGSRQRLGEDFTQTAETLNRQNDQANEQNMVGMADRGMLRSGANLVAQGRLGEQFQRGVQGAVQGRERGFSSLADEEANVYNNITSRQRGLEGAATERARVKEEARLWQEQQAALEQQRMVQEQQQAEAQLAQQQQQAEMAAQQQADMQAQLLAASQPVAGPTGGYEYSGAPTSPNPGAAGEFTWDAASRTWKRNAAASTAGSAVTGVKSSLAGLF